MRDLHDKYSYLFSSTKAITNPFCKFAYALWYTIKIINQGIHVTKNIVQVKKDKRRTLSSNHVCLAKTEKYHFNRQQKATLFMHLLTAIGTFFNPLLSHLSAVSSGRKNPIPHLPCLFIMYTNVRTNIRKQNISHDKKIHRNNKFGIARLLGGSTKLSSFFEN